MPLKAQKDYIYLKFWGHDPFAPPGYAYAFAPPRKFSAYATGYKYRFPKKMLRGIRRIIISENFTFASSANE